MPRAAAGKRLAGEVSAPRPTLAARPAGLVSTGRGPRAANVSATNGRLSNCVESVAAGLRVEPRPCPVRDRVVLALTLGLLPEHGHLVPDDGLLEPGQDAFHAPALDRLVHADGALAVVAHRRDRARELDRRRLARIDAPGGEQAPEERIRIGGAPQPVGSEQEAREVIRPVEAPPEPVVRAPGGLQEASEMPEPQPGHLLAQGCAGRVSRRSPGSRVPVQRTIL